LNTSPGNRNCSRPHSTWPGASSGRSPSGRSHDR
jgi:hypothetical protein